MTVHGLRLFRTGVASSLVISLLVVSAPAQAKAPAARLSVHAAEASFHVGSTVVVTGTVAPKATAPIALQRLVGKKWVTIAHVKPTAVGAFTFSVKAGKSTAPTP
jgi:hypothetical protein